MTGNSLEESYEGFTLIMLRAITQVYGDDHSRTAKKRRTQLKDR